MSYIYEVQSSSVLNAILEDLEGRKLNFPLLKGPDITFTRNFKYLESVSTY